VQHHWEQSPVTAPQQLELWPYHLHPKTVCTRVSRESSSTLKGGISTASARCYVCRARLLIGGSHASKRTIWPGSRTKNPAPRPLASSGSL
jgi:hypothetical protein